MTPGRPVSVADDEKQGDAGVVAVEFALVLPALVALLFTIVTAGSVYIDQLQLQSVARDAARIASVSPATACTLARSELSTNNVGTVQCTLVSDCLSAAAQARLSAQQTFAIPIVGNRTVTLHASSTFACPSH